MINSILIPVIVAYYVKSNIYETSGLVDNTFMMSFSIALTAPVVVIFDPLHILTKVIRLIKRRPCIYAFTQQANSTRTRKNTTCFMRASNLRLATSISMWSTCSCSSASLSHFNPSVSLLPSLDICLCTGFRSIRCSTATGDLFLPLISSIRLSISSSISAPSSSAWAA